MSLHFSHTAIDTRLFPSDYAAGRQQWLTALQGLSANHRTYHDVASSLGPHNEALITDSAWIGKENARNVVVVIAGTHGIEGFVGSAIQSDLLGLLTGGHIVASHDTALLLIHALTPWGYAWLRRCDAEGVDLNRNAVDFSQTLPDNPDYDALRPALFAADAEQRQRTLTDFAQQYGRVALEKAISGGQYRDPTGPFYGGSAPAHGRLVCEDLIRRYGLQDRRLAVIDLHSGLGAYGYGEVICDHAPDSAGAAVARQWYGDAVTLPLAGTSSSVPKWGLLDYLWHAVMNPQSCYITLEFGTFSTDQLFETLLHDHQLWAQADKHLERIAHGRLMRQHFCPEDTAWQEMVLFRGRQVIVQALRGLSQ